MAFLIDQLNNSGLFAQSAYSACIATKDSDGNDITATYLTGVDLTPYQTTADMVNYQTTAGMTGYATTGDVANKLDTTAFSDVSGTFLTAHQSLDGYATTAWVDSQGYLTAHQPISADEWNDVYNTVNINSGSWTGSESSPTASVDSNGSIDIVSSNNTVYFDVNGTWFNNAVNSALPTSSVQWNSNYETVNTNSGVWGGSALNISAGEGVKVTLVNNNLVFSTDETVLWEGTTEGKPPENTINLSEPANNFEKLAILYIDRYLNISNTTIVYTSNMSFGNGNTSRVILQTPFMYTADSPFFIRNSQYKFSNTTTMNLEANGSIIVSTSGLQATYLTTPGNGGCFIFKVIGINRKNNA